VAVPRPPPPPPPPPPLPYNARFSLVIIRLMDSQ
jgi:hypothetical protein